MDLTFKKANSSNPNKISYLVESSLDQKVRLLQIHNDPIVSNGKSTISFPFCQFSGISESGITRDDNNIINIDALKHEGIDNNNVAFVIDIKILLANPNVSSYDDVLDQTVKIGMNRLYRNGFNSGSLEATITKIPSVAELILLHSTKFNMDNPNDQ